MKIGQKIELLREIKGYTREELGLELGYPKSSAEQQVEMYETGKRKPKRATLEKYAAVLNVSISAFVPEHPVDRAVQEVFWLSPDDRLEVEIAMEELEKMEDMMEVGDMLPAELSLWKFQYNANNTLREEQEWN